MCSTTDTTNAITEKDLVSLLETLQPNYTYLVDPTWNMGGHVSNPFFVLYCIVLYCIVLYCIVLYCIVLYCIVLYCIVLFCFVLFLFCFVLFCFVLFCFVLFCFVLFCFVLWCWCWELMMMVTYIYLAYLQLKHKLGSMPIGQTDGEDSNTGAAVESVQRSLRPAAAAGGAFNLQALVKEIPNIYSLCELVAQVGPSLPFISRYLLLIYLLLNHPFPAHCSLTDSFVIISGARRT